MMHKISSDWCKSIFLRFLEYRFAILLTINTLLLVAAWPVFHLWTRTESRYNSGNDILLLGGSLHYDYKYDNSGMRIDNARPNGGEWINANFGTDLFNKIVAVDLSRVDCDNLAYWNRLLLRLENLPDVKIIILPELPCDMLLHRIRYFKEFAPQAMLVNRTGGVLYLPDDWNWRGKPFSETEFIKYYKYQLPEELKEAKDTADASSRRFRVYG